MLKKNNFGSRLTDGVVKFSAHRTGSNFDFGTPDGWEWGTCADFAREYISQKDVERIGDAANFGQSLKIRIFKDVSFSSFVAEINGTIYEILNVESTDKYAHILMSKISADAKISANGKTLFARDLEISNQRNTKSARDIARKNANFKIWSTDLTDASESPVFTISGDKYIQTSRTTQNFWSTIKAEQVNGFVG